MILFLYLQTFREEMRENQFDKLYKKYQEYDYDKRRKIVKT